MRGLAGGWARRTVCAAALCALAGAAAASDLAGDADAARVEELVRKDDWAGARAIWRRRGADAGSDVGRRWRDVERYFRDGPGGWTQDAHRARRVAMLAAFLDRDALGEDACRVARERANAKQRAEMAWWTALTLTRLGRPAEAAPFFAEGAPVHAFNDKAKKESAALTHLSARIASGESGVEGRIALANRLCALDGDEDHRLFASRAASGMLRRTLDTLPVTERSARLCAAAFFAALHARDASDLAASLAAWRASGADVPRGVADAVEGWRCGDGDPFAGHVARIAVDSPVRPSAARLLAHAVERFVPGVAERLLRTAAAHRDDPKLSLALAETPDQADEIAAINARRTLALVCERRRRFAEALEFWKRVRPYGGCGTCMGGIADARAVAIDRCLVGLGRGAEVLAESSVGSFVAADWISPRLSAAAAAGRLDAWVAANSGTYPLDGLEDELADALRLERMCVAADAAGLIDEILTGGPIEETLLTPWRRLDQGPGTADRRAEWRRERALELLRDLDGREVDVLVRRLAELPASAPATRRGDRDDRPRRSLHTWLVAALANSRSPAAAQALTDLRTQVLGGKDVGVSAAALDEALRLHTNDLLWVR